MNYVILFFAETAFQWIVLLIVVPVAQKLADFSLPPWPERLWKLAVVAAIGVGLSMLLTPVNAFLALAVSAIAFFALMAKWFDADLFGAIIIAVISRLFAAFLGGLVLAKLMAG